MLIFFVILNIFLNAHVAYSTLEEPKPIRKNISGPPSPTPPVVPGSPEERSYWRKQGKATQGSN